MTAITTKLNQVAHEYHLNAQEVEVIEKCVNTYSSTSFLAQIINRIFNAVKSLFGRSDFQIAKRIMRTHTKDELRAKFALHETHRGHLDLAVKNGIVKTHATMRATEVLQDLIARNLRQRIANTRMFVCCGSIISWLFCPSIKPEDVIDKDHWTQLVVDRAYSVNV